MSSSESEISKGEVYTPFPAFSVDMDEGQKPMCFDRAKLNMFYLVEPRWDAEGIEAARGNPVAVSIDKYMDGTTRRHLQGLPLPFLSYWGEVDKNRQASMSEHWGDYLPTMKARAAETQSRLLGREEVGNVVKINFRRIA